MQSRRTTEDYGHVREDGLLELPTGVALQYKVIPPPPAQSSGRGYSETGGAGGKGKKLAVCLHPWSWLGGGMNDPVLFSLEDVLHGNGYHVLRYNSRGVGRSTGRATFTGLEEGKDLEGVVLWGIQELGGVSSVVIIGYSHGSLITTLHPGLDQEPQHVKLAYVLLSYPLGPRSFLTLFKGSYYDEKLDELITASKSKILIAFGGRDEFTSFHRYKDWVKRLKSKAPVQEEEMLSVLGVPEATHFWFNESNDKLQVELARWLGSL
ncbi:alpha/beta-hydrolase [Coprinellus micaceus]|uniref:Alpha/beta-hydrolase n=1 Tax=Coprinellus micaceus TaxID=71717 RepID=A0A4Y7T5N2_COPMI|nr:alpha/beta-hydrolase [Coprinellus micaceus]